MTDVNEQVAVKPGLPAQKSMLEQEIEKMMEATDGLLKDTKTAQRDAERVRRKSKELEQSLSDMAAAAEAWNGIGGRGSRRSSKDYDDEELRCIFESIDKDGSGTIE